MANLRLRKLVHFRILAGVFVSAVLAPAMCAQTPRQLQVEGGPNQEIRILASGVSYGEVLRALQEKLGWEIEIPALADELKLSSVDIKATQPPIALAKLLEGSGLGYALLAGEKKSQSVKVIVIPSTPREASVNHETAPRAPIPDNAVAGASSPPPAPAPAAPPVEPTAPAGDAEQSEAVSTMPLSEAINAMGVPPDVSSADVGRAVTLPLSEAINAMGVPPGVSSADVGRTMTLPISEAAGIMGVPPGMTSDDVGKTTTLPLPTRPGNHP